MPGLASAASMLSPSHAVEGTLWAVEPQRRLPDRCEARVATTFVELAQGELPQMVDAMGFEAVDPYRRRLQTGRRGFALLVDGAYGTTGWVSQGSEGVDELQRTFTFDPDDAYIWDCVTRPDLRGKRLYSAFLSHCIYHLYEEGAPRIWIGSNRENVPSIKGFENAGFRPVVDVNLRRWGPVTFVRFYPDAQAPPHLVEAARRAMTIPAERRLGNVALGYRRGAWD
ncbi:MAG: GNAT family N-acetyltransferase [Chloroflexota bacterium]